MIEFRIYLFRLHSRDIAISFLFRCQRISEKKEIDNLTFFGINVTLFNGKNDMCLKNTNLPCAYQIDPGSFFFCADVYISRARTAIRSPFPSLP